MSFLRCCVGADPRLPPDSGAPRPGSAAAARAKAHKPAEVFFDIPKPEAHLSSITDPATSARDPPDHKLRKESREKGARAGEHMRDAAPTRKALEQSELDLPDNNGLSRGQNFMKVEKWLRECARHAQDPIAPRSPISNLEDSQPPAPAVAAARSSDAPPPPQRPAAPAPAAAPRR